MKKSSTQPRKAPRSGRSRWWLLGALSASAVYLLLPAAAAAGQGPREGQGATLEETRLTMGKWIETQQILAKERNEWQQGKEILGARLELLRNEVAGLQEKVEQARTSVAEAERKRDELAAQEARLAATNTQLATAVTRMEAEVRRVFRSLPEVQREKLAQLYQRIPEDPASTRATVPERFQNVLGILTLLNQANDEITVSYEVRELADGKPSEVRALYVGLAQAYYVSASGEAGIGRPGADGWTWEPTREVAGDVFVALDILQGKHTPAFVPLPVRIQ